MTTLILIWFLLLVATVFRQISGENPNANEWEIH